MKADFSGYVTKANLKCSDGRTILPNAFQHQDKTKVPLVWQHGHTDPESVLGHVILENRADGVYGYGFFNETGKAKHAAAALEHGDYNAMSIWANKLIERAKQVLHGTIREVSLVLGAANPGALIESVTIRHADGDVEALEDEAIIYTGLELTHGGEIDLEGNGDDDTKNDDKDDKEDKKDDETPSDEVIQSALESMSPEQQKIVRHLVGSALSHAGDAGGSDPTIQDVIDSMSPIQQQVLELLVGEAMSNGVGQDALNDDDKNDDKTDKGDKDKKGTKEMKHNVFENDKGEEVTLSHDDMKGVIEAAKKGGSFKAAVEEYALAHGITDIGILFPDAVAVDNTPEFDARRMEWVSAFLGAVKKSPFSRIKTLRADITPDEARAKGYVKGALKKEEFFAVTKRETTPTTIYKKQALDRDDVVDITDFDVVAWLKGEMRLLLDEELARAALIGDGRDVAHEDKINEQNIRPIAKDHELFVTTVNVNLDDANSNASEIVDAVIRNRRYYKGSGRPTFFTTEEIVASFLILKDGFGRRLYQDLAAVAAELRVQSIVTVEVMEEEEDLVGVIVNPVDYTIGATRGGEVTMFDDFDIDYNKQKYLIETRCSGSLTKLKSALVLRKVAGTDTLVTPAAPTFDSAAGELTITDTTGVTYTNADTAAVLTNAGSPYTVASGATINVHAEPTAGNYFESSEVDDWSFTAD